MGKNKEELSDFNIKFNDLLSKIEGYEKAFENKIDVNKLRNVPPFGILHYSISSVAYSPDSKRIISGSADNTIKIWDANTGTCIKNLEEYFCKIPS